MNDPLIKPESPDVFAALPLSPSGTLMFSGSSLEQMMNQTDAVAVTGRRRVPWRTVDLTTWLTRTGTKETGRFTIQVGEFGYHFKYQAPGLRDIGTVIPFSYFNQTRLNWRFVVVAQLRYMRRMVAFARAQKAILPPRSTF